MKTGDVYWIELPDSGGREQSGRRPAVIIQDDTYAISLPTTIVIPLSSAMAALRFPGTTQVKATEMSGLRTDSVALAFQIRAIDRSRIKEQIGTVTPAELAEIQEELGKLLGN
jgi:mRNA interferase MazF